MNFMAEIVIWEPLGIDNGDFVVESKQAWGKCSTALQIRRHSYKHGILTKTSHSFGADKTFTL